MLDPSHPDTHARCTAIMIRPCKTRDDSAGRRCRLQTAVRNRRSGLALHPPEGYFIFIRFPFQRPRPASTGQSRCERARAAEAFFKPSQSRVGVSDVPRLGLLTPDSYDDASAEITPPECSSPGASKTVFRRVCFVTTFPTNGSDARPPHAGTRCQTSLHGIGRYTRTAVTALLWLRHLERQDGQGVGPPRTAQGCVVGELGPKLNSSGVAG
eukprot:scaffold51159_cov69-Phaeocystis_antarctica.AAC.1